MYLFARVIPSGAVMATVGIFSAVTAFAGPADVPNASSGSRSESPSAMSARLNRLERDLQFLQRHLYNEKEGVAHTGVPTSASESAELQVGLSEMEEQLRSIRGTIEETQHHIQQLTDRFEKFEQDIDYRLQILEEKANAQPAVTEVVPEKEPDAAPAKEAKDPVLEKKTPKLVLEKPADANPREEYNRAFALLNDSQYEAAASAFRAFVDNYPEDPLLGNAYYWLGEAYFVRGDFVLAADQFRLGFETQPTGPKAADNLLRLGMTLGKLEKVKEGCVVLKQLLKEFGARSTAIKANALREKEALGCDG